VRRKPGHGAQASLRPRDVARTDRSRVQADPQWHNEFADRPAPFSRWDATAPGCLDVRVFDQDRYWVDAPRIPHVIGDRDGMTDKYLRALIDILTAHAEYMLSGYLRYRPIPMSQPPQWMESTTLMCALRAEIQRRAR
jgi:hypothetical protein